MKYAISGGHELTVGVAEEILLAGGNAFDAAIAAYLACFVTEPCMASAGAGGLALIHTKKGKRVSLDFFCQTPKKKKLPSNESFYPIDVDFGETTERFYIGIGSVATPGAIAGVFHLLDNYGSMPLEVLIEPAIKLAKEGVLLNEFQAYDFHLLRDIMSATEDVRRVFCEDSRIKKVGESVKMPNYADFLYTLAKEGKDLFYKGEIAQSIVRKCEDMGGNLSISDFEDYRVHESSALSLKMKNGYCNTASSPSIGGAILLNFLHQIENSSKSDIENVLSAYSETIPLTKDLNALAESMRHLTGKGMVYQGPHKHNGTSHFNISDRFGNAIALSTTVGEGCGEMIPNTDMQLNNMLGELALLPNGLHSWEQDRRLISMMSPTMLYDNIGALKAVMGTGGAGRIPFMIGQVIHKILRGQRFENAITGPRLHVNEGTVHMEPGIDVDSQITTLNINKWEKQSLYFGGVHSIFNEKKTLHAFGDKRRHGYAVCSQE